MAVESQNVILLAMWAVAFLLMFAGLLIILSSLGTLRYWWIMRRLDPVGPGAVEPGLGEVTGRAQQIQETVTAPFSEHDTLVCEWEIFRYSSEGGAWQTEEDGSLTTSFEIEHEGSSIAIDPANATEYLTTEFEVKSHDDDDLPDSVESFLEDNPTTISIGTTEIQSGSYRFIEKRLDPGEQVYVLGSIERDPGAVEGSTARHTIAVDQSSWLSAILGKPFIISDSDEKTAERRQLKQGLGLLGSGTLLSCVGAGIAVFVSLI
jgi:hypothetical protein